MKTIPLTKGQVALVDDADYEWLSKFKWFAERNGNTYYAARNSPRENGKQHMILMHREILKPPPGFETDHRDCNELHNWRDNLRIATHAQNQANKQKVMGKSSKFKGVSWFKRGRKWQVGIKVNRKSIYLGLFDSEEVAACAYDKAALKHFGEFARTNF